jgi:hypothetical protein
VTKSQCIPILNFLNLEFKHEQLQQEKGLVTYKNINNKIIEG